MTHALSTEALSSNAGSREGPPLGTTFALKTSDFRTGLASSQLPTGPHPPVEKSPSERTLGPADWRSVSVAMFLLFGLVEVVNVKPLSDEFDNVSTETCSWLGTLKEVEINRPWSSHFEKEGTSKSASCPCCGADEMSAVRLGSTARSRSRGFVVSIVAKLSKALR